MINEIIDMIRANDKIAHFVLGILVALIQFIVPQDITLGLVIGVGAGKEIYDFVSKKGTPEFADFVFTVAGGAVCSTIIKLLF